MVEFFAMQELWDPFIEPLLSATHSPSILEIGTGGGRTLERLLHFARKRGTTVTSIDVVITKQARSLEKEFPNILTLVQGTSLDVLPKVKHHDVVLIDGDHNWYTVFHELSLLTSQAQPSHEPLILLHDVGWPYGRRDLYYDVSRIPKEHQQPHGRGGVMPEQKELIPEKGLNVEYVHALEEGKSHNGVLTAVEDFLEATGNAYAYYSVPLFSGLGCLVPKRFQNICEPIVSMWPKQANLFQAIERNRVAELLRERLYEQRQQETILNHAERMVTMSRAAEALAQDYRTLVTQDNILKAELCEAQAEIDRSQSTIQRIFRSRSWRWTAPLRSLEAKLRGRRSSTPIAKKVVADVSRSPVLSTSYKQLVRTGVGSNPALNEDLLKKNVTVVIPVYRDVETVLQCLLSCKQHIDQRHTILILNDNSTEPDMEKRILKCCSEMPNARYERNSENLGFVSTCNRAVLELDASENDILLLNSDTIVTEGFLEEMLRAIYAHERHAVVCPRSDNATLLSIPVHPLGHAPAPDSFDQWLAIRDRLPRYHIIPTGVGFCMLVKRTMIQRFGLFDEIYSPGYNEENDFCCRLGRAGFSTIMANHAFVFHSGNRSFSTKERAALEIAHKKILHRRYPEYPTAIEQYWRCDIDPMDQFCEVLAKKNARPRFLFDLSGLQSVYNGTNEYALSLLERMIAPLRTEWDVTIAASIEVDEFFKLSERFPDVRNPSEAYQRCYNLAFVPHQIFTLEQIFQLNRSALRWAVTMHDIIALRIPELRLPRVTQAFDTVTRHADGLICISHAVWSDMEAYFGSALQARSPHHTIIYNGVAPIATTADALNAFPDRFLLVVGNHFSHKALPRVLSAIDPEIPLVVLGDKGTSLPERSGATILLQSGSQTPELLEGLYRRCSAVVFSSQYEGFGLPLLHAERCGKPAIAFQSEVNQELKTALQLSELHLVRDWKSFAATAKELFEQSGSDTYPGKIVRSWDSVASETMEYLTNVMKQPIDLAVLRKRWDEVTRIERSYHSMTYSLRRSLSMTLSQTKGLRKVSRLLRERSAKRKIRV